jgi:hypothetical protein
VTEGERNRLVTDLTAALREIEDHAKLKADYEAVRTAYDRLWQAVFAWTKAVWYASPPESPQHAQARDEARDLAEDRLRTVWFDVGGEPKGPFPWEKERAKGR